MLHFEIPLGLNADGFRVEIQSSTNLTTWGTADPTPINQGIRIGENGQASGIWEMPAMPTSPAPPVPQFFRVMVTKL